MRYAIIENGRVANIAVAGPEHAAAMGWTLITDSAVAIGWRYEGGAFTNDPAPLTKDELITHAADTRWKKETGGITIQGIPVDTTRDSQAMINGAFSLVSAEPTSVIKFKATGGFVELDAAAMTAIAVAVGQHVQAAFATEAEVLAGIEAGTITTTAQIDAAFA